MFISPAFAQAGSLFGGRRRDMLMSLLPFVADFRHHVLPDPAAAAEAREAAQEMVKNVRRGDTVITNGGLVGKVTKVIDDEQIEVEIADDVRVRQMRSMVADVRAKGEPVKEEGAAS